MSVNERFMPVRAETVWDVLADAQTYEYWVVGSKLIRDVEDGWPEPGSRFHHTVGFGPFTVDDHTVSLEADRPRLLTIRAKARPFGTARVRFELRPSDGGTAVRMSENPDNVFSVLAVNPLVQALLKGRNAESLQRLEELALRAARRKVPA